MNKKTNIIILTIVALIIIISGLYYYLTILGGPIKKKLVVNNCSIDYYLTDNIYQIEKTYEHVSENKIELGNAKIELAKCLCDSYLNKQSQKDSIEIINILNSKEYCDLKTISGNTMEDIRIESLTIDSICMNKDKYLQIMLID